MADQEPTTQTTEPTPAQALAQAENQAKTDAGKYADAEKALESGRRDAKITPSDFVGLSVTLNTSHAAMTKSAARVTTLKRTASQGQRDSLAQGARDAIVAAIGQRLGDMKVLELTGAIATITTSESGKLECQLKWTGPGAATAKASGGSGGRRGRATLGNGSSWNSVAEENGVFQPGANNHKVMFTKKRAEHDAIPHECQFA